MRKILFIYCYSLLIVQVVGILQPLPLDEVFIGYVTHLSIQKPLLCRRGQDSICFGVCIHVHLMQLLSHIKEASMLYIIEYNNW